MTAEPHVPTDPLTLFQGGAAAHPARQAWLLEQLEQWFAGDLADGRERRRVVAQALRSATEDAHRWLDDRLDGCDLVRVDLLIDGDGTHRHSVFRSLPTPLGLLLICLDQCRVGHEVRVVQELAKAGRVEARATWPFGMDEAETLTRPARVPAELRTV
ncbi:hypothetical protein [Aquihabitans sp. McL0605]|uniref:hypothetical protein n=1 Tax=Aquihabitans sp. McL0605 TaxID=3415671 RepID=UPI003CECA4EC